MHALEQLLASLETEALPLLGAANSIDELFQLKARFLGKKGQLSDLLKGLKDLDATMRPLIGDKANQLRDRLETAVTTRQNALEESAIQSQLVAEKIDITLPGRFSPMGAVHPLSSTMDRLLDVFTSLGFAYVQGPEVETDFCCFQGLNLPLDHPARDMQDTLYVTGHTLLRTQTSAVQVRAMLARKPPLKVITAGAVYRRDSVDATHSPMFHQLEGLCVDKNVTMEELKGTLQYFAKELFGTNTKIRMRGSYFPFTEPSVEVDCSCVFCKGNGCKVCKQTGWLEILGAGMVHPNVFEQVGINPAEYSGFACGLGIERIAMLLHGVDDIRHFYENDLRFLEQFA
jgi:phenylalanyl-tRNA synthetase alpha chain